MWQRRAAITMLALALLALQGCPPTETPGYSPDGKTIALVAFDPSANRNAIWLYDVQTQTARAHHVPGEWTVVNVQWIGPQLWVECSRNVAIDDQRLRELLGAEADDADAAKLANASEYESILCPFDPAKDQFIAEGPRIVRRALLPGEIRFAIGSHAGKPALFVEADSPGSYEIYNLGDGRMIRVEGKLEVFSAGRGWSVQMTPDAKGVAVLDAAGARVCTIGDEQIALACYRNARSPIAARVSANGKVIALAFNTETIFRNHPRKYTFGVFSIETGKLLWAGGSDSMDGVPLVKHDQLWTIELVGREVYLGEKPFNLGGAQTPDPPKQHFALVRHHPGKTPSQADRQQTLVFEYDLGKDSFVQSFAPSPDGSQILVAVNGVRPRLLFVPVQPNVGAADVKTVELKGRP